MSTTRSFEFETTLHLDEPGHTRVEAGGRVAIAGGPPPEFGGSTIRWSPEHLLVSAAGLCFVTTLEWHARRHALELRDLRVRARGTVEKSATGLAFTGIERDVTAVGAAGQGDLARELIGRAEASCIVSASLRCPVRVTADVTEGSVW